MVFTTPDRVLPNGEAISKNVVYDLLLKRAGCQLPDLRDAQRPRSSIVNNIGRRQAIRRQEQPQPKRQGSPT